MPYCPEMISPASSENHDTPMPMARPAQMLGNAPGRTTWRKIVSCEAPSVCAARTLGANKLEVFWYVVIPAALPSIAAGLAIGMGVAWFSLLAGEIISGQYGIGYFTWNAYSIIHYPDIVVGMLAIGLLGTGSTELVRQITKPALAWQRKAR